MALALERILFQEAFNEMQKLSFNHSILETDNCLIPLEHGQANDTCTWLDKSGLLPDLVNKVLLKHKHTYLYIFLWLFLATLVGLGSYCNRNHAN